METVSKFLVKKEEAYESLQKLKEANAPETDIQRATTLYKFWEVMEMEEGEDLGNLLMEFAILVGFDYKLIKPIADKDAGFWSDIEGMGFLDFQLTRLRIEHTKSTISILQSIDLGVKKLVSLLKPVIGTDLEDDKTLQKRLESYGDAHLGEEKKDPPVDIAMQYTEEELDSLIRG